MITTKRTWSSAATALPLLFALPLAADGRGHDDSEKHEAQLSGYQEVPTQSSSGMASFKARIADDNQSFDWVLTYSGFTTANAVTQSHIHFGARAISGGIVVFLCTNLGNAPLAPAHPTAACPAGAGTVSGTATAADVTGGAVAQGIAPGEFAKVLDAIRAGVAYANIHTVPHPPGEIRGQIQEQEHEHHDD
jgi:hypothetical protein